jgi:N-acetylglucosaminyldiphosphoundecaprenol N-acetyl-beta-D-mannosaminyltransferase
VVTARPLVTVITPALNERQTLPLLERSLSRQELDPQLLEWIVVDDGSTDSTLDWLRSGARSVRPLVVESGPSCGPGLARNAGIERATGPFCTFVDADDTLEDGALGAWLSAMSDTPADMLLTPTPRHLSNRRRARLGDRPRVLSTRERWSGDLLRDWLTPGKLYATDFLTGHSLRFGGEPEAEDLRFFVSAALSATTIAVAPTVPSYTYWRSNRSAARRSPRAPEATLDAITTSLRDIHDSAPRGTDWLTTASPVLAGLAAAYLRARRFASDERERQRLDEQVKSTLLRLSVGIDDLWRLDQADRTHALVCMLALAIPDLAARGIAAAWVAGLSAKRPAAEPALPPTAQRPLRLRLLSAQVTPLTGDELASALTDADRRLTVGHLNVHGLALAEHDPEVAAFLAQADLVFVDGMPIVWYLRSRGEPVHAAHRTTVLDWLPRMLDQAVLKGRRVYHVGGTDTTATVARQELLRRHPGLQLMTHHGYLGLETEAEVLDEINRYAPHVLLVGMGMPQQERWVNRHRDSLDVPAVCTVGGALSYLAGEQATPPRWLGPAGLEGVFRLARHPRRLGHRYLVEPWSLVRPLAADWRAHRHTD